MSRLPPKLAQLVQSLLSRRYLLFIGSILFFLVIGLAFFLVYQNARLMHEQINHDFNQQQLILARQAAAQIDMILTDIELELETMRRWAVGAPVGAGGEVLPAMAERIRDKGLVEVVWADAEGRRLASYPPGAEPGPEGAELLAECGEDGSGRLFLGPLREEPTPSGQLKVLGSICARTPSDRDRGEIFLVRLDISRLVSTVTRQIRSGKTGYAWVIDENGTFLYHPEAEFIGKNAFVARQEREPYISFTQINQIMRNRMQKGEEGVGVYESGWHRGVKGRITKLIAFTPLRSALLSPGRVWSVAVAAPISEVAETVHRFYLRHFAAEAALIAGMFVFGLLVIAYQVRISQALRERVEQTEANLQETERVYQRVVEQATDLIYILDLDLRVVLLNRHSLEVFSQLVVRPPGTGNAAWPVDLNRPEIYLGRRLDELFGPADVKFMRRQIERVLERKASISYEQVLNLQDRKVHLSTKLIPIRDAQGEIYQVLGISRDVTEKMEMDQRIYHTEKLASIGTLAAGVAHEINNPLAVILGFTDLLLERFEPGSPVREDLEVIEYNASHAKRVVEKLLGFARITEGLEDIVEVKSSTETVLGIVKNTLMTKKIELRLEVPDHLPRVRGDPREFQQVLFNLINNSVAAMGDAGGVLTVAARVDNGWVQVSVTDTGIGIPDRIKPQIFDPFFTTKKVGEGTGLGLSLCYGIVKKYGGKISFVSSSKEDHPERPSGTTFTVSFPVVPAPAPAEGEVG